MILAMSPWRLLWEMLKYHFSGQALRDEIRAEIATTERPKCPYCGR